MFDIFTSWSPLLKSRTDQLNRLAELLKDKAASDITFTAIDLEGNTQEYVLGSIEGNSKFLLGYCNPGFHLAPYHFVVIDPNVTDEEANKLFQERGHPANPRYWVEFGVEPFAEGDKEGTPHPSFASELEKPEDSTFEFAFQGKSYSADPENQLVYSMTDDRVYHWSLLRNTFFASQNPELYDLMELHKVVKELSNTPDTFDAEHYKGQDFEESTPPLVKAILPKPGSVLKIDKDTFAMVSQIAINFMNSKGIYKAIDLLDNKVEVLHFDSDGVENMLLLEFMRKHLNIDIAKLETCLDY